MMRRARAFAWVLALTLFAVVTPRADDPTQADDLAIVYPADRVYFAHTADGWDLSVIRFRPEDYGAQPKEGALPVILMHGLSSTSVTWHLGDFQGLAPYLAMRGYDVWAANLRGRREGSRPTRENGLKWGWMFEDYLDRDVPAVIDMVLAETGAPQVNWVGHSMGGILLYTYLIKHGDAKIRAGTTLGSPMTFDHWKGERMLFNDLAVLYRGRKRMYAEALAQWVARSFNLDGRASDAVVAGIANPENFPPRSRRIYLYNALPDLSVPLLLQFNDLPRTGKMIDPETGINFGEHLSDIRIPMLVLCGNVDALAPPESTRYAYERLSSSEKVWIEFSRANGYAGDYGHVDLVLGTSASIDVYPVVAGWIAAHDTAAPAE